MNVYVVHTQPMEEPESKMKRRFGVSTLFFKKFTLLSATFSPQHIVPNVLGWQSPHTPNGSVSSAGLELLTFCLPSKRVNHYTKDAKSSSPSRQARVVPHWAGLGELREGVGRVKPHLFHMNP